MVNISKNSLEQKHLTRLFSQLNAILSRLSEKQTDAFLTELLGPEERVMLAKRLAAIVMLFNEHSQYRIAESLKLSTSTVNTIADRYQRGDFVTLQTFLKRDPVTFADFVKTLDTVLHLGFLPRRYNARDRWKNIR